MHRINDSMLRYWLSRVGEIRYLRVLYGSDKAPVRKGQTMFEQYKGGDFSQFTYTSDGIEGEVLAGDGTTTTFNLDWTPVVPGSVNGSIGTGTITDDGNGNIKIGGSNAGTINYATGAITFATAPNEPVDISYNYNNMEVEYWVAS